MNKFPAWKRFFWKLRDEARAIGFWAIAGLPAGPGRAVRAFVYRRALKELGTGVVFQSRFGMTNPECISIGSNCNFAEGVYITGGGGVTIGDWVGFGPDTKIWSVNHRFEDPERPWLLQGYDKQPVVIEDDVWLGANVFVAPGVSIGRGAVVAAGAVVNKNIPAYALVCGNPARVIGWRKKPESPGTEESGRAASGSG